MPGLILFAACRQVLINARDETVTLVGLLEVVEAVADGEGQVPSVADVTWEYLSVWRAEPGDEGQSFEQRIEVVRPDRSVAAEARHAFQMQGSVLRVYGTVAGFPTRAEGPHTLRLSIRNVLDPDTWVRVHEYPVLVRWIRESVSPASPQPAEAAPQEEIPPRRRPGRGTGGTRRRPTRSRKDAADRPPS